MKYLCVILIIIICLFTQQASAQAASVNMLWDYTPNNRTPTGFRIYRQNDCTGPVALMATVPITQLTYMDTTVAYNKLYCWTVKTFDAVAQEESTPSNVLRFQVPQEPLAVPQNLRRQ